MNIKFWWRRLVNYIVLAILSIGAFFAFFCLAWILCTLLHKGLPGLNWQLFIQRTLSPGAGGGLLNAIVGSFLISVIAVFLGGLIGILVGIYIAEYHPNSKLSTLVKFILDIMLGVPSIILGLFVYEFYVIPQHHFSAWAGSIALILIVIPIVSRATENMYQLIPNMLRESIIAIGAPQWRVIHFMLFYVIKGGILTGLLLSLARILGEAAPLLFTTLSNQFVSFNMNQPMANLPVVVYNYAMSPFVDWQQMAWSGALFVTSWILIINILTRYFIRVSVSKH